MTIEPKQLKPLPLVTYPPCVALIDQIVERVIDSEGVIDVLKEAGLSNPEVSIFTEQFLEEVKR